MKKIKKNVYTESNRFHQFSFSSYDESGEEWFDYKDYPTQSKYCDYQDALTYTLVGKSFLGDTPMSTKSLEFLSKELLKNWSVVREALEPVREKLKYFEITLSYNNYGSTLPVFEFQVKNKYKDDVRDIYDILISLDMYQLMQDALYSLYQTDLDYVYPAFNEDMEEEDRVFIIQTFLHTHKDIGWDVPTLKEFIDYFKHDDYKTNYITKLYNLAK